MVDNIRYAVISNPRTGSRSLAKNLSAETGHPIGYIHKAQSVESSCLTYKELISKSWTLHGHWHTLQSLSEQHLDYIRKEYTIVEIIRDPFHAFISSIITMATGDIEFTKEQIPEVIDTNLVDVYFKRMEPAYKNRIDWQVDICYNFDKYYNISLENFNNNIKFIKNFNEIEHLYLNKINKDKLC